MSASIATSTETRHKSTSRRGEPSRLSLNPLQVAAIRPFLPALIGRYQEVADTGETALPDPVCAKAGVARCFECPVFGEQAYPEAREPTWIHCSNFLPTPPPGVRDERERVTCWSGKRTHRQIQTGKLSTREQAQAWGRAVVAWLQEIAGEGGGRHGDG